MARRPAKSVKAVRPRKPTRADRPTRSEVQTKPPKRAISFRAHVKIGVTKFTYDKKTKRFYVDLSAPDATSGATEEDEAENDVITEDDTIDYETEDDEVTNDDTDTDAYEASESGSSSNEDDIASHEESVFEDEESEKEEDQHILTSFEQDQNAMKELFDSTANHDDARLRELSQAFFVGRLGMSSIPPLETVKEMIMIQKDGVSAYHWAQSGAWIEFLWGTAQMLYVQSPDDRLNKKKVISRDGCMVMCQGH
ncbi:unnamed protein product [Periconia digitata]|uniref:Uncharacterized protein n=1 Tax=Periconia digitata TaxID=1303443 RepID=A0A9W4XMC7_9PLEO|nr:unnamed protein product [Periconia digitata]